MICYRTGRVAVQKAQRFAARGILERHSGHSLVVAGAGVAGFSRMRMGSNFFRTMKMTKATMTKSKRV